MTKPESISVRVDGSVTSGFTVHFFKGSDTEPPRVADFVATVAGPADGSQLLKAIRDPRRTGAPGAPPVPIPVAAGCTGALSTATAFGPNPFESPTGVRLDNLMYRAPEVAAAIDAVILAHGRDGISRLIGDRHLTPKSPHSAATLLSSLPNIPGCPSVIVPAAAAANPAETDNDSPHALVPAAPSPLGVRRRLRHSVTFWEDAVANANAAVVAIGHAAATFYTTLDVTTDTQELYPPTTGGSSSVSKSTSLHLEQQPVQQALCKYHLACAVCPPLLTTPPPSSSATVGDNANVPAADNGNKTPDHEPQADAVAVVAVPAAVCSPLETLKYRAGTVWRKHERLVRVAFAAAGARDLAARFLQRMAQLEAEWAAANSGPATDAPADAKMATVLREDEAAAAVFDAAFDAATGASMMDALVAAVGTESGAAFGAEYIFASLTPERFAAASQGGGM